MGRSRSTMPSFAGSVLIFAVTAVAFADGLRLRGTVPKGSAASACCPCSPAWGFDEKLEKQLKTDNEINLLEVPGKAAGPPPKPAPGFVPAPYFPGAQEAAASGTPNGDYGPKYPAFAGKCCPCPQPGVFKVAQPFIIAPDVGVHGS